MPQHQALTHHSGNRRRMKNILQVGETIFVRIKAIAMRAHRKINKDFFALLYNKWRRLHRLFHRHRGMIASLIFGLCYFFLEITLAIAMHFFIILILTKHIGHIAFISVIPYIYQGSMRQLNGKNEQ